VRGKHRRARLGSRIRGYRSIIPACTSGLIVLVRPIKLALNHWEGCLINLSINRQLSQPHRDQVLCPTRPSTGNPGRLDRGICSKLKHGRMKPTSKRNAPSGIRCNAYAHPALALIGRPLDHNRQPEFALSACRLSTGLNWFQPSSAIRGLLRQSRTSTQALATCHETSSSHG